MAKLFIPSRNRPTAVAHVLEFLARFYPGTQVVLGDGSADHFKPLYQKAIAAVSDRISVDYRPYDPDVSLGFRVLDILNSLDDDLVIMGADDDFPIMDTLLEGETFLKANPGHVLAIGSFIDLRLYKDHSIQAAFGVARPIEAQQPQRRALDFSMWPFPANYSIARRAHLIDRYDRAQTQFLAGFHDYTAGIHDAMTGKIKAIGKPGFFRTHNYRHSYLRSSNRLSFLKHGDQLLGLCNTIAHDLEKMAGLQPQEAQVLAERLIRRRIAQYVGGAPQAAPDFAKSTLFLDPIVQQQYAAFQGLFTEGHPERARLLPLLRHVMDMLLATVESTDNEGEKLVYETLEAQAHG